MKYRCQWNRGISISITSHAEAQIEKESALDILKELRQVKLNLGLIQKQFCSDEEQIKYKKMTNEHQKLPLDVFEDDFTGKYVRYVDVKSLADISNYDINLLISAKQLNALRSIRKSLNFFVALVIISCIINIIIFFLL